MIRQVSSAAVALTAAVLIALGLQTLSSATRGIAITHAEVNGTPVSVFRDKGPANERPVVVISHGFAGSQQLMHSYALALARQGMLAVTFDYLGHGRHPRALGGDITKVEGATQMLVAQTRDIVDYALALPDASSELAILGHSMASDIIVRYAATDPRVQATVAISMFSTAVTETSPRNLLVIVGGWEGFLKEEALRVMGLVMEAPREAVTVGDVSDGSARRIAFADGVEHVGVLYSDEALGEATDWLLAVSDRPVQPAEGAHRGLGIVALLAGMVLLSWPLSRLLPRIASPALGASLSWRQLLFAALVPALGTPLLLVAFPADFMGTLVGGYLAVHFLVYGLLGGGCLWWLKREDDRVSVGKERDDDATRPRLSLSRFTVATITATLYLALAFGWALDSYVTSYAITATRAPLAVATLLGTLAYFLVDEWIAHGERTVRGAHLFTRLCFLLSLGIAVALSLEDLFFLLIIAAVIVIYFLIYGVFSRLIYQATGHPAVGAIANAVSFAWALAAVFPFIEG